jgi:BlaI family penicillinase repressor
MQISDAEWIVMNLVWETEQIEANEVIEQLAEANDWSPATVKTMLHRLVKKGALSTEPIGKRYLYRSSVKRQDCVRQASRTFLDRVFGGHAAPALMHFVKASRLSTSEIAELKALLDSKEAKRKESDNV